jgi:ATP adenylyltransferase
MGLDREWAGWRLEYIEGADTAPTGEGTLFERILAADLSDEAAYIVARAELTVALLNAYPYTSGHLLVLPRRGVADIEDLTDEEHDALWGMVRVGVGALRRAYGPEGVNVGLNLGAAAGAGVPDHLHVHLVPRWAGDTNFMTAVAETRVLPEALGETWRRLRAAWPD